MRTVESTVYTFDELSERAKETARTWYREASDQDFSDYQSESCVESLETVCTILGITLRTRSVPLMNGKTRQEPIVYWSGFCSQGDGACFEGSYSYAKGSKQRIRKEFPQDEKLHAIADSLREVQSRYFYHLGASMDHRGHSVHEMSVSIDVEYTGDSYRKVSDNDQETVIDSLRDVMRWFYRLLESEYEYQNSDETVDENIRCNEYEFDENGNRA